MKPKTTVRTHDRIVNGKRVTVRKHSRTKNSLSYAPTRKPFSNMPKGTFPLPIETAVLVPSTSDKDKQISRTEFEKRTNDTERFLAETFGGFTQVDTEGGFVSDKGNTKGKLITEKTNKVTAFATEEAYRKNQAKLKKWILSKKKDWKQESMGYEFEGDLFYI